MIGVPAPGEGIIIAEGYATAASLHEWSGFAAAVSFGKQNLLAVGEVMRLHYPHCELAVAADVDGGDIAPEAKAAAEFLNTYLMDPRDYGSDKALHGLQ